jgi:NTE family protein
MQQRANTPDPRRPLKKRRIALALQGGGSHGAFTWGVLDRLLREPSLEIVGISGTSAGAMNAGVLADGLRRGGASQAQLALHHYWEDVGRLPGYASMWPQVPHSGRGTSTTILFTSGLTC